MSSLSHATTITLDDNAQDTFKMKTLNIQLEKTFVFVEDQLSKAWRKESQEKEEFKYEIGLEDGYIWWPIA